MEKRQLKRTLAEIGCKIVLGLALTEKERALWELYGKEKSGRRKA